MSEDTIVPVDPLIGSTIADKYRVVRKLGEGGMGVVYEGLHVMIGRRVAIKVLHASHASKLETVQRFQREARAATAIGHPNIVEVTDMGQRPDGSLFMVLEFLEGHSWQAEIDRGPQELAHVARLAIQVCGALGAAHAKGIVHRDLKPDNVFVLDRGGQPFVKVLDFGISKVRESHQPTLTESGAILGTPYYMAPEQAHGRGVDHRADVYALGVILYYALAAAHPFDAETLPMLLMRICVEPPRPLEALRPDLPAAMIRLIESMLAKSPDERPASTAEVAAALAPFADPASAAAAARVPLVRANENDVTRPGLVTGTEGRAVVPVPVPAPVTPVAASGRTGEATPAPRAWVVRSVLTLAAAGSLAAAVALAPPATVPLATTAPASVPPVLEVHPAPVPPGRPHDVAIEPVRPAMPVEPPEVATPSPPAKRRGAGVRTGRDTAPRETAPAVNAPGETASRETVPRPAGATETLPVQPVATPPPRETSPPRETHVPQQRGLMEIPAP